MPRCYMVKKGQARLEGPPPCSPTEASVAPPCYTPDYPASTAPRTRAYAELRNAEYDETQSDYIEPRNEYTKRTIRYVDRSAEYEEYESRKCEKSRSEEYAKPRTVRYLETLTDDYKPNEYDTQEVFKRKVRYIESRSEQFVEPCANYSETRMDYDKPSDYTQAQTQYNKSAEVASTEFTETQTEFAEPVTTELNEPRSTEYAELGSTCMRERSAADTEAAHELLSLAASVPPLPPAAVLTVLRAPEPVLPLYTYTLQPTNIYIIAEESPDPNLYHTVQTIQPIHQVEYATIDPQVNYIAYQEAPVAPPGEYPPAFREPESPPVAVHVPVVEAVPVAVPVSVIEPTPTRHVVSVVEPVPVTVPLSVQVPVIEPVPQQLPPELVSEPMSDDPESDESTPICTGDKKGKYDCNECGKRYATSSNLSRHKQTHRSLDSLAAKRCGECGKAYVSMPALAMHVLTHRMGHVCGVCGKQFSRPWLLRGHLRSHTGEKPYNCESCGKAFADRSNLRAHLQTHSGDKKYECPRCNKNFALKSYLNKHQESACTRDDE